MSRPLRIGYPGAWYHVMNRGRRKEEIFFDKNDFEIFLEILNQTSRLFSIEIHAYALMPNHYHLLIHTPLGREFIESYAAYRRSIHTKDK